MDVILLADRKGQELSPLTDETSVALLPLAGKMVIEHCLEALVEANLRQAHIVLSAFADEIKEALGNGERWGMRLTYSTSRGDELPSQILTQLPIPLGTPFLMLRGDVVRSVRIKDFIQQAEAVDAPSVLALCAGHNAYLILCKQTHDVAVDQLHWVGATQNPTTGATLELNASVALLDSLAGFYQANLDAATGRLANLFIPGKQAALGLTQGRNTEAYPQNLKQGIALIGSNCHLHPSVELNGEVVIGDNVIIDRRVNIESSVILPYSYIGELVEIRNAIVRGNDLIRIDTNTIVKISDSFLLADLKAVSLNKGLGTAVNRSLGALLLICSAPLWLLAVLVALITNKEKPFIIKRLRGNKIELNEFGMPQRTEFSVLEWQVNPPVLRFLPRLLAVITGDLNLIGTLPVSMEVAAQRSAEWEKLADQAPAGLLGPTQLEIPISAPEEEKLMSDTFYAANYNFKNDLRYLCLSLKTLFTHKAWFYQ